MVLFKSDRAMKILSGKRGVSFVYVLGVMALLLGVSFSAYSSAATEMGSAISQINYSAMTLLSDSAHKNVLYSLKNDSTLSEYIIREVYEVYSGTGNMPDDADLDMTLKNSAGEDILTEDVEITLSFSPHYGVPPVFSVDVPDMPKTADVAFKMYVTVTVKAGDRKTSSKAGYEFRGGMLLDTGYPDDENMEIVNTGEWELTNYEKIDV